MVAHTSLAFEQVILGDSSMHTGSKTQLNYSCHTCVQYVNDYMICSHLQFVGQPGRLTTL